MEIKQDIVFKPKFLHDLQRDNEQKHDAIQIQIFSNDTTFYKPYQGDRQGLANQSVFIIHTKSEINDYNVNISKFRKIS